MKKIFLGLLMLAFGLSIYSQRVSDTYKSKVAVNGDQVSRQKGKMNIIFFLVDDMGWSDLGYEGSRFYETPRIDSFSKAGVRFTDAYAACHVCSPSRASILTGEYPARLHLTDWLPGRKNYSFQKLRNADIVQHLPYGQLTLPKVLQENGYHTAIIGKWHLGEDSASTSRQGFDIHIPDYNKGWPNGTYFSPYGMKGLEGGPKGEYLTDRLTKEALQYIDDNKDHPFFLYLAHFAVHDPIEGRPDLVEKYKKKLLTLPSQQGPPFILESNPDTGNPLSADQLEGLLNDPAYSGYGLLPNRTVKIKQFQDNPQFAAMVESVDESLGQVLDELKRQGLSDKTIVVFFADNGGMSAANYYSPKRKISPDKLNKAFSTSNLPLRGGKGWMYEGGIREPMIVKWPGVTRPGMVCNVPVISTDFYPTLLDMVGIPLQPEKHILDGVSIVPLLKDQKGENRKFRKRPLYWHFPQYSNHGQQSPGGAIRFGDYKLLVYYETGAVQLFNLKNDPGEHKDLSSTRPGKVKELSRMFDAWRLKVKANMPVPNPNYDPSLDDQWQEWKGDQ